MAKNVLTDTLSEPLQGVTAARVDIHAGDGNLTIDRLPDGDQALASGTLEYLESQPIPTRKLVSSGGQATLTLKGSRAGKPWFHLPWQACNGATDWQIYLNPTVSSDITAHSDGGNVRLNLAGMAVTGVLAGTGGGNMVVVLPENSADLCVTAKTGAGNVTIEIGRGITGSSIVNTTSGAGNVMVLIPAGVAARIHATTGLGEVIMDPCFGPTDKNTYESADFERAVDRVEITVHSGAGSVIINTRERPDNSSKGDAQ